MTKNTIQACWWHPQREATYIVNLGTSLDADTLACDRCAQIVRQSKEHGPSYNATIIPITKDVYDTSTAS